MSASVEEDICFDVDGTATHGTLRVPAHRAGQRLAAALLLPGSGPVDRNGDVPGLNLTPRTLALIAGVLGGLGVMSLRFDKYFTGRTGAGAYAQDPGRIDQVRAPLITFGNKVTRSRSHMVMTVSRCM